MSKIKLGIIGIGNIGKTHVKNVVEGRCPEVDLVAVADWDPKVLQWCTETCPDAKQFSDAKEMIDSGVCDSIIVSVPHYDHVPLGVYSLEKGLNTLVEKPIAVYTKQAKELIAAGEKSEGVFALMYNQRTDPLYIKLRELVQGGELGEMIRMCWIVTNWYRPQAYYNSGAWRASWKGEGGGVLLNQSPHQLDLWQWICGMPVSIQANLKYGSRHVIEVEDEVVALAKYPNGAVGTFITSTCEFPGTNRLEIVLDGGTIVCENGKLEITRLSQFESVFTKENKVSNIRPEKTIEIFDPKNPKDQFQHSKVLNAFAGNILRGDDLIAVGAEGIKGLSLSNAMHLSSFLGGKEITFPIDEDQFYDFLQEKIATSTKTITDEVVEGGDFSATFN
ncbi:MAG: Gfo/Idh/MocA family oxidoreductase [Clostridia bacterium]